MKLYFVTSNKGKYVEVKEKLSQIDIDVVQKNLGYPEIQADTLEEVTSFGIENIKERFDKPFIIEDAGLFIDELKGFPGVYSSYVYHTVGCKGILNLMRDKKNRKASFKSVFGYYKPETLSEFFIGECNGVISEKEIGSNGFGYDPIFIPKNEKRTFAQMNINEKNSFSHRGKSLDELVNFLKKL